MPLMFFNPKGLVYINFFCAITCRLAVLHYNWFWHKEFWLYLKCIDLLIYFKIILSSLSLKICFSTISIIARILAPDPPPQ